MLYYDKKNNLYPLLSPASTSPPSSPLLRPMQPSYWSARSYRHPCPHAAHLPYPPSRTHTRTHARTHAHTRTQTQCDTETDLVSGYQLVQWLCASASVNVIGEGERERERERARERAREREAFPRVVANAFRSVLSRRVKCWPSSGDRRCFWLILLSQ